MAAASALVGAAARGTDSGVRVRASGARDPFILGDRTLDVAHRAFEIRDACLVLRGRSSADRPEEPADGPDAPHEADDGSAVRAEAAWLFAVLHEDDTDSRHTVTPPPSAARTPSEEIDWLLKVAAVYGRLSRGHNAAPPAPPAPDPVDAHDSHPTRTG
ncbi:DUF6545 domain-containing protein [Streptomyces goshikiensis]|uniref:DUF6545 domain-containing protein n=1 Tax=Streptomyces goshikiensis TaxID=1942 RepID=UPI0036CBBADC